MPDNEPGDGNGSLWGQGDFRPPDWHKPTLRNFLAFLGRWRVTHTLVLATFSVWLETGQRYRSKGWELVGDESAGQWHGPFTYVTRTEDLYRFALEYARHQYDRGYTEFAEFVAELGEEYDIHGIIDVDGFTLRQSSEERE